MGYLSQILRTIRDAGYPHVEIHLGATGRRRVALGLPWPQPTPAKERPTTLFAVALPSQYELGWLAGEDCYSRVAEAPASTGLKALTKTLTTELRRQPTLGGDVEQKPIQSVVLYHFDVPFAQMAKVLTALLDARRAGGNRHKQRSPIAAREGGGVWLYLHDASELRERVTADSHSATLEAGQPNAPANSADPFGARPQESSDGRPPLWRRHAPLTNPLDSPHSVGTVGDCAPCTPLESRATTDEIWSLYGVECLGFDTRWGGWSGGSSPPKPSERTREIPQARLGSLKFEVPGVRGRLAAESIQPVVEKHAGFIKNCYGHGLRRNPNLEGAVLVRFVIGRDGKVANVVADKADLPDSQVVKCTIGVFYELEFPRPETGIVTAALRIVFEPLPKR